MPDQDANDLTTCYPGESRGIPRKIDTSQRLEYTLMVLTLVLLAAGCQKTPVRNRATNLFNGVDLHGWHMDVPEMDGQKDVRPPFLVRNNMLVSLGKPKGHLITNESYENYRLEVEYRFAGEPGNCGILVHASKPRALYKMFPQSLEVQLMHQNAGDFWCIVEDISVADMESRRGPKEEWGITEGKQRRIVNLTDGTEKPLGEWNNIRIECLNRNVTVWLNSELVNKGFNCTATRGQIALQAEGAEVEFRKVLLTPL